MARHENLYPLRLAASRDVPALSGLRVRAYTKYIERIGRQPAPMTADYAWLVEQGDVWVLEGSKSIAGAIVLTRREDHLYIGNVAVDPDYQGQGLGRLLLQFAEAQARKLQLPEMRLFTNAKMYENLVIHERLGWARYDEAEHEGFHRVFMKKAIAAME